VAKRPKRLRDPMQLAKLIGDIATGEAPPEPPLAPETAVTAARRLGGPKEGKAQAIARKAANARWKRQA